MNEQRFQVSLDNLAISHPPLRAAKKPLPARPTHISPSATLLKADKLAKSYGGKVVVNGLSIHVGKGEVVGLLGPNGAGKTTAFYMTIGLIKPDAGSVFFKGQDITNLPIHERARMGLGYLSQEPSIFRNLTVEENILCILETLPLTPAARKLRLEELLCELHLTPLAKKRASALSGGERRRLEITRALIIQPSLLLLDEPFANIDPLAVQDVKKLIRHLKNKEISVLITDHNAREIFSIVDRSYLVRDGKVLMSGTVDQLLQSKEARTSYFGEDFKL
ncbi:MAG TPA: LPS export ABC transporter ATP-binding protein [Rhabdochlamydiaceae bacterium]|jgi:lipopolysaccharide export system ATP-binding protein